MTDPCDQATNALRIIHNEAKESKKPFGVCIKALEMPFADFSVRLVEWLEIIKLMAVDKVFMYHLHLHPNVTKVRTTQYNFKA